MQIKKIAFLCLLLLSSTTLVSEENELTKQIGAPEIEVIESLIKANSIVGYSWVSHPIGKVLLIKTPSEVCAIRYLSFSRKNDKEESSAFKSGDESFDATAERWSSKDGKITKLTLKKRPFFGIGKLGFSTSKNRIQCGGNEYIWEYPTSTVILPHDQYSLLSPTKLDSFESIELSDKRFDWFGYEEYRTMQIIPMDD